MSTDPDKNTPCPETNDTATVPPEWLGGKSNVDNQQKDEKRKKGRCVSFPDDNQLVTQYFEPANPWQDVATTTRAQLAAEYLEACRRHNTLPIDSVLQQIRDLPDSAIGFGSRAARLTLSECILLGAAPADALEALLRKVQFRRIEMQHTAIDDEGAEAMFDMIEYYESATAVCISGPRQFGIRGWQAASRMIKTSAELTELEVTDSPLEPSHAPVLARALRPHSCRLRVLCLQRAELCGEPLLCLVIALKSNNSVRELRLGDNRLSTHDALQLSSLLRLNSRIQLLDLSNNQIQDAGVGHLATALSEQAGTPTDNNSSPLDHHWPMAGSYESRGLAFLVLWNNQLTRNCAHHLAKALRSSPSLCVLNVGRNAIGIEGVRALCGGSLVSLGLQAARLGPDAAPVLAELLRHTTVQRLDLRENRLGTAGLQAIATALKENNTITQIDLDDPPESTSTLTAEENDCATVSRLTRDIRALCRRNDTASSPERKVHRKISLTCRTECLARGMSVSSLPATPPSLEEPRARLRSPLPSPAGSPIPAHHHHSRFSVTKVTPERESSTDSSSPSTPTRPTYCATPSRFRVVQVAEPPQIQIHPASQPRRNTSRFSVTRNYDSVYNPSSAKPDRGETKPETLTKTASCPTVVPEPKPEALPKAASNPTLGNETTTSDLCPVDKEKAATNLIKVESCPAVSKADRPEPKPSPELDKTASCPVLNEPCPSVVKSDPVDKLVTECLTEHCKVTEQSTELSNVGEVEVMDVASRATRQDKSSDDKSQIENSDKNFDQNARDAKYDSTGNSDIKSIKSDSVVSIVDKKEEVTHNEQVDSDVRKTETKLVKNTLGVSETEKVDVHVEVTVLTETKADKKEVKPNKNKDQVAMKQIEAITEDLGNLIQEMKDLSTKTSVLINVKPDSTHADLDVPAIRGNIVLKKNKSESSLDSPDLEVSRLMNKKLVESPFCDSSSSLEISGSSVESLNALEVQKPVIIHESVAELDRRKADHVRLSTGSSIESNTSEITPVNCGTFLNMSVSSNESVSPIIFGKSKKIHDSLSSLEASVSSLDSGRHEKVMVTSADSGIEYSLQNPSENKEDNSSNEGTLTNNSSLKESVRKDFQDTLTSPKRTSSLLDVPALKNKGIDRMKKMSWVAPSPSFHIPRAEPEKETKLPSNLEKLLSLFQHPSSLFSRSTDEEKKTASNTPPRKDSSLTSAFWSWGSAVEKDDKEDSSSEATDSTLSERIQVSFVDESFSKKLDSKTPSTDTDTLSEFQTLQSSEEEKNYKVTHRTTDELVQKLVLSTDAGLNGNQARASDNIDLRKPNDLNKNVVSTASGDKPRDEKEEPRPRSFAAVLKSSGSENSLDKQTSPETGQPVDKLPSKVIRGIKENISPENTLTSSMSNTKALAIELSERQVKPQPVVTAVWEVNVDKDREEKTQGDLAPIATIEETSEENLVVDFIDDAKFDDKNTSSDSGVTSLEGAADDRKYTKSVIDTIELENVDLGKDALSYLIYENQEFQDSKNTSLAQELKDAEIKELLDISPELVIDEAIEVPEIFVAKDRVLKTSPVIPERAKIKKANSLEELSVQDEKVSPKAKTIAFKVPETTPRDIPRKSRLRTRSGSSPKSLPESLNKPCPLTKMDTILCKKKKKVSSLGKMARDSLLALNMTDEEIAEFRKSYKLTSVESLKSLESVSEDANSQSGNSVDSRCRSCLRMSQESLMSLDSITEDCRCTDEAKPGQSNR